MSKNGWGGEIMIQTIHQLWWPTFRQVLGPGWPRVADPEAGPQPPKPQREAFFKLWKAGPARDGEVCPRGDGGGGGAEAAGAPPPDLQAGGEDSRLGLLLTRSAGCAASPPDPPLPAPHHQRKVLPCYHASPTHRVRPRHRRSQDRGFTYTYTYIYV